MVPGHVVRNAVGVVTKLPANFKQCVTFYFAIGNHPSNDFGLVYYDGIIFFSATLLACCKNMFISSLCNNCLQNILANCLLFTEFVSLSMQSPFLYY